MRHRIRKFMRQVLDWHAALWSGLISGVIFITLNMLLTWYAVGSPWVYVRMFASIVMGKGVLPPPASFEWGIFIVGTLVSLALAMLLTFLITSITYRWGLIVGFLGGGLLGLAIYVINFYSISYFFPWFYPMRSWMMLVSHIIFGALAGGIYEILEVEEFVPVERERSKA